MNGAERVTVIGKLRKAVVNKAGQIVALALETDSISRGTYKQDVLRGMQHQDVIWKRRWRQHDDGRQGLQKPAGRRWRRCSRR